MYIPATPHLFLAAGLVLVTTLPAHAEPDGGPGSLYRNGGHFGPANSDAQLEQAEFLIAGAPSGEFVEVEARLTTTPSWPGTLYRNGGHFGPDNSDVSLEDTR